MQTAQKHLFSTPVKEREVRKIKRKISIDSEYIAVYIYTCINVKLFTQEQLVGS